MIIPQSAYEMAVRHGYKKSQFEWEYELQKHTPAKKKRR